jgi:hypothetical protein
VSFSETTRVMPSPDVVAQPMGDQAVIVHLVTNRIYDLNATAARIWDLLSAGRTLAEVRATLLREYEVEVAELDAQLQATVALFRERKLVEIRNGE